jgi:imidazolonepropionase-like amidohydrolase
MSSTLIYNITVWQWSENAQNYVRGCELGNAVPNSFVAVRNGFIEKVGLAKPSPPLDEFDIVIDGKNRFLIPGLIGMNSSIARVI